MSQWLLLRVRVRGRLNVKLLLLRFPIVLSQAPLITLVDHQPAAVTRAFMWQLKSAQQPIHTQGHNWLSWPDRLEC